MERHIKLFEEFINEGKYSNFISKIKNEFNGKILSIKETPKNIIMKVSGDNLLTDDGTYYEVVWFPYNGEILSTTFSDSKFKKPISSSNYAEDVEDVEDFIALLNNDIEFPDWESKDLI